MLYAINTSKRIPNIPIYWLFLCRSET